MKKLLPFAIFLLLALGTYFVFQSNAHDAFVVKANDGNAELRIPKDAVLEGGTIENITITAIAPKDFFKESNQPIDSVKIYRLEPDGLTLSKPARISVTFPYDPEKTYFPIILVHSNKEGAVESLNVTDFKIDEKKKTLIVSGEMRHFSDYFLDATAHIFNTRNIPEGEITLPIGQSLEHTLVITPGVWDYSVYPHSSDPDKYAVRVEVGNGTRWVVHQGLISTLGRLEPKEVVLEKMDLDAAQEYRVTNTFTCRRVGEDHIIVVIGLKVDYTLQLTHDIRTGKPRINQLAHFGLIVPGFHKLKINCVAPPTKQDSSSADVRSSEETPSSTASPTPTTPKTPGGIIKVCGLPGGEPCLKR